MASPIASVTEHTIPCNHIRHYARSTSGDQGAALKLHAKQYKPRYEVHDGDATIVACGASAFPKELYEPMWEALFKRAENKPRGRRVRAIFIADVANQGYSGVLNKEHLGDEVSWFDHARDYLSMANHLRADMIRPIMGFGHSMGGNVLVNLALMHPRLLTSLVVFEPIINRTMEEMEKTFVSLYFMAAKADTWPSRDTAIASLSKIPLYAYFDKRVLARFGEHGLTHLDQLAGSGSGRSTSVTLTTTKAQDLFSYARAAFPPPGTETMTKFAPNRIAHPEMVANIQLTHPFHRPESYITFQQLPFLRPSCFYIYGSKSYMAGAKPKPRAEKLHATGTAIGGSGGAKEGRVKDLVVSGSHFAPFEIPDEIATITGEWLDAELERHAEYEAEDLKSWQKVPLPQRSQMNEQWIQWVKKLRPVKPNKGKAKL